MTSSNSDPVRLNSIDWLKLFPTLHLLKAARLGIRIRVLVPSLIMMLCVALGPEFESKRNAKLQPRPLGNQHGVIHLVESAPLAIVFPRPVSTVIFNLSEIVLGTDINLQNQLLVLSWNLLLLSVLGVAVSRAAGSEFCAYSRTGAARSLRFSLNHVLKQFVSTALAIVVVAMFLGPFSLAGWLAESSTFVKNLVSSVWLLFAMLAAFGVLAAIVSLTGWLLSIAAIGVDTCDGADALSRGINYTLSHKLRTFWYLIVAGAVSVVAKLVVIRILTAVNLKLAASFSSVARFEATGDSSNWGYSSANWIIENLPDAVHWGTFMSAVTIVYVLLRQREDAVNLDEMSETPVNN